MKSILFSAVFALLTAVAFSTTVTITNSGTTFTPSTVTIQVGDTVKFQLEMIHNALEVSQATWNANGTTPLPGFSVDFGGGIVTGLTTGDHYYICVPHSSLGMKGKIIVNPATGISNLISGSNMISIYPNPTTGKFIVQYRGSSAQNINQTKSMEIYNLSGKNVYSLPNLNDQASVDLTLLPEGTYFVKINDKEKIFTKTIVKQ